MLPFHEFMLSFEGLYKPFLIVGKGSSFDLIHKIDLGLYNVLAINHAIRKINALFTFIVDYHKIDECYEDICLNSKFLVVPWIPHIDRRPRWVNLNDLVNEDKNLQFLSEQGKLLFYNAETNPNNPTDHNKRTHYPGLPVVPIKHICGDGAFSLLASAGVKRVHTIGIGDKSYSEVFKDCTINNVVLEQLDTIKIIAEKYDMEFINLSAKMNHGN
jgi:hypothetical protein